MQAFQEASPSFTSCPSTCTHSPLCIPLASEDQLTAVTLLCDPLVFVPLRGLRDGPGLQVALWKCALAESPPQCPPSPKLCIMLCITQVRGISESPRGLATLLSAVLFIKEIKQAHYPGDGDPLLSYCGTDLCELAPPGRPEVCTGDERHVGIRTCQLEPYCWVQGLGGVVRDWGSGTPSEDTWSPKGWTAWEGSLR